MPSSSQMSPACVRFLSLGLMFSAALTFLAGPARAQEKTQVENLTYPESQFHWEDSNAGATLRLDGAANLEVTDRPALPVDATSWVVPRGWKATSARLVDAVWENMSEQRTVMLAVRAMSSDGEAASPVGGDTSLQKSAGVFPERAVELAGTQWMNGYSVAMARIVPVRQLADGTLQRLASARLEFTLALDGSGPQSVHRRVAWPGVAEKGAAEVREVVRNPQRVDQWAPPRGVDPSVANLDQSILSGGRAKVARAYAGPVEFLIVTPAEFAPEMQRLADYRTEEGLRSAVVTMEDVLANYRNGGDQQETLRMFLRNAYQDWGLQYILLAGDSEFIAPRYVRSYFYPYVGYTDIPSDMYYACLDGNWNADADGIYGEAAPDTNSVGDDVDLLAELSIGRAPVQSLAEAQLFVDKVLAYSEPIDPSFAGSGLFMGEVLFPQNWDGVSPITLDGATYAEDIVFNSIIGGGNLTQSWRLYENYTSYLGAELETKQAALDSLSSGNFHLAVHEGHGFYYNMSVGDGNIFVSDVSQLNNAPNYFFLYALNCSSGAFDFDCLLEAYIQHPGGGAVGTVGSSRAAFPTTANFYQQEFFNEIYVNGVTRVGDAQRDSRAAFAANTHLEGSWRWTHFSYHLFCDPTLRLWREVPSTPSVSHLAAVPQGTQSLTVTVTSPGAVQGADVAVSHPDGRMSSATTDGSGTCVLDLDGIADDVATLNLMVSGKNLIPYHGTVDVQPGVGAHVRATSAGIVDDGTGASVGDGDGLVDSGETIEWSFQFENNGDGSATTSTTAQLVPVNATGVNLIDDSIVVGAIAGGGNVLPADTFVLGLDPSVEDGQELTFDLQITEGGTTWSQPVSLTALAPQIEVSRVTWDDSAGNGDGVIDAGEPIALSVELVNYGAGDANLIQGTLSTSSGNVSLTGPTNQWSALGHLMHGTGDGTFGISESDVSIENWIQLSLSDDAGHVWTHDFELRPPAAPVAPELDTAIGPTSIILRMAENAEPHFYGYRAYRSQDPGGPFVEFTNDRIGATGVIEDDGLQTLTRYYYKVAMVDSSGVSSALSPASSASTSPPELAGGFPIPVGREVSGALAVGDVLGDGTRVALFGADYIYGIRYDGSELLDGDNDSQTLGPLAGDPAAEQFTPCGIALADLDGDGAEEIISGNWIRRDVWVVRGDGTDYPGWPQPMNNKNWATPAIGDLDNNGDLEIVVNNVGGRTYVFNSDGTDFFDGDANPATVGVFQVRAGENFNRSTPLLLDVDNDGTREILFGTHWRDGVTDNMVYALRNDATNAPGWPKNLGPLGYAVGHMTAADLDGDGQEEITFLCDNDSMYVWEKDGSNFPGYPQSFKTDSAKFDSRTPAVAFGDFDKDGLPEMVVVSIVSAHDCEIYIKEADGTTWPGWPKTLPGLSESSPLVADINGDLSLDVVFGIGGGSDNDPNVIYAFNSDGTDVEGFPITLPGAVRSVPVITDLDQDGDVDLVYAGQDMFLHVWDMPFPYRSYLAPWPTFQGNMQRTGVYYDLAPTPAVTASVGVSATPNGIQVETLFFGLAGSGWKVDVDRREVGSASGDWTSVATSATVEGGLVRIVDSTAEAGRTYEYRVTDSTESLLFYSEPIFVPVLKARLEGAVPNPFNPSTEVRFEIPGTAGGLVPAALRVYDLSGRLVRTLVAEPMSPGKHAITWNGQDDSGARVASGVYFARLSCAGVEQSTKLTLVK